jgi:putative membrane protein
LFRNPLADPFLIGIASGAGLGAVIAMSITAAINRRLQRDFAREWSESLRVKHRAPLGEFELLRLWRTRRKEEDETRRP